MHEFTSDDREDVTQLLTDIVDRVVDDFLDSADIGTVYYLYGRYIKSTAEMIARAVKQGGAEFDQETIDRAKRVEELFSEEPPPSKTWNWETDSAYEEDKTE